MITPLLSMLKHGGLTDKSVLLYIPMFKKKSLEKTLDLLDWLTSGKIFMKIYPSCSEFTQRWEAYFFL